MAGKKKDPNRVYNGWGGKREGAGSKPGVQGPRGPHNHSVGHNGGRKPPEIPKRQRNIYVTDEEFEKLKDYLWDVLRAGQSQANRKYKVEKEEEEK